MDPIVPTAPSLSERFTGVLRVLLQAAVTQRLCNRLSPALMLLVHTRLTAVTQHFQRLAAAIAAGTYRPRKPAATPRAAPATPQPPARPEPRARKRDPQTSRRGWLAALLPDVPAHRGRLLTVTRTPEMAALMAVAPVSLKRRVRSLYWALGFPPPPVLALPARPRPPRPPKPPKPPKERKRKPRPEDYPSKLPPGVPEWMRMTPSQLKRWSLAYREWVKVQMS